MVSAETITATFSSAATPPLLDPALNTLFCVIQKLITTNVYGFPRKAPTCTHAAGVFTISIPSSGIPVSTTVLVTIRLISSLSATPFTTVTATPFRQYLDLSMHSKINVAVVELKNPIKTIAFT
jgi:hypothetical protein